MNPKTDILKRNLVILFLLLLANLTFAKGRSGVYYLRGIAYAPAGQVLKNTTLTFKLGETFEAFQTDSSGRFEIKVQWHGACPSGRTRWQHRRDNRKANPKYIYILYGSQRIRLHNKWKAYTRSFSESNDKVIRQEDLHFE
jgi:hypothetical protein